MNETDAIGSVAVLGADGGAMAVARSVAAARAALAGAPRPIGLVPTMGALHDGHLALLARARAENATVVMSLFVNPTQFAEGEDLAAYPRDEARDLELAHAAGVDLVFAPPVAEIYPPGFATSVSVAGLGETLEGSVRGAQHFQGVATVVAKLLNIIAPQVAYFGQKDVQQALVIGRMARDLDIPSAIEVVPTVREPDGLALSSRNAYLDPVRRAQAVGLSRALRAAAAAVAAGERSAGAAAQAARDELARHDLVPDYVAVVDPQTLAAVERIDGPVLVALAARVGPARLIDNLVVAPSAPHPGQPAPGAAPGAPSSRTPL